MKKNVSWDSAINTTKTSSTVLIRDKNMTKMKKRTPSKNNIFNLSK